jgi:dihydropyrimidinase
LQREAPIGNALREDSVATPDDVRQVPAMSIPPRRHDRGSLDMAIRGGRLVTSGGYSDADLGIHDGRIVQIGGELPHAEREIDARGLLVLPGGIDMHVHLSPADIGEGASAFWVDDFESGSRAAAAGGVTTVGNMTFPRAGESIVAAMRRHERVAETQSIVDFILHPVLLETSPAQLADLRVLADDGYPSIKIFMVDAAFERNAPGFLDVLDVASELGLMAMLHCEDGCLVAHAIKGLIKSGKASLEHFAESRPVYSESAAVARAIAFCRATQASIYIVHLSSAAALQLIREARSEGLPVYAETRPLYLHFNQQRLAEPDGALFTGHPPIRAEGDRRALWAALRSKDIQTCCTDHAPWRAADKRDPARTVADAPAGLPELETLMPMLFSEGVRPGLIDLETFVEVTSTNAARLFGIYPRKGTIAVGSDADLVVWDPEAVRVVSADEFFTNSDYSPYEGRSVTGWPRLTIRRGEILADSGRIVASPGSGRRVRGRREPLGSGDVLS